MSFIRILLFIGFFCLSTSKGNCINSEDQKKINLLYDDENNYQLKIIQESILSFELYDTMILLPVKLNDTEEEHLFILDTGATTCVLDQKLAKKLGIHKELEVSMTATGDNKKEKTGLMAFGTLKQVQIGNSVIEKIPVGILDFKHFCDQAEGIIGNNFLKFFKIVIDYSNKKIILSNPKVSSIQSPNLSRFEFKDKHGLVKVPIQIDNKELAIGIIDTGANKTTIPTSLVEKLNYNEQNIIPKKGISGGGAFGLHLPDYKSYLSRLNTLKIGENEIKNFPMNVEDSDHSEKITIGYDLLSHFKVSIDYSRNEIALDPTAEPFKNNVFTTGLGILDQDERKIVINLLEKSPADINGIQVNDEILEINGIPVSKLNQSDIKAIESDDSIKAISYKIKESNGNIKEIALKKKLLFPKIL
ncbi:MAG: hypothetical protein KR126chlam5_00601 [Candidatus Anoxychlamydiales bacterium]|nr:hypothetical protein [Candidatus Anoxychlamydiales bacterium]